MRLFDSHTHLNDPAFEGEIEETIKRAKEAGVEKMVVVGYDVPSSKMAVELAKRYKDVIYASVALHPHDSNKFTQEIYDELKKLAAEPEVVAIGETGLDYYRDYSPREDQRKVFREHLKLARETDLPVIIHTRKAFADLFSILEEEMPPRKGVFHCFSGGEEEARRAVGLGFYVSFSGSLTFSKKLQRVATILPADRILIETDAPYLAPVPMRGRRNEPAFLVHTTKFLAELLNCNPENIGEITYANAEELFLRF